MHKKNRTAGRYIDVSDLDYTDNYNTTLDFIWKLSDSDCAGIAYFILREPTPTPHENVKYGLYTLAKSAFAMEKHDEFANYALGYMNANPNEQYSNELKSMYTNLLKSGKLTKSK